jgi:hypothetical protein
MEFDWDPRKAAANLREHKARKRPRKKRKDEMADELRPVYNLSQLLKGGAR